MPARLGTSGSVRASSTAKSDRWAHVVHTFCPVTTQSSPSRSARVASDARSDPEPGSLKSWHQVSSLRTMGGRKRSRCSSVPWAKSAGAARFSPKRVQPTEVVRTQLLVDPARHVAREVEAAVGDRPGRHDQPRRTERRIPRLVLRPAPHRADLGRPAPAACVDPTGRHDLPYPVTDGTEDVVHRRIRAHRQSARAGRGPGACAHRPVKFGGRFSLKAASPSRKSSLRDESSMASASFCSCSGSGAVDARVQEPLREPDRDRRRRGQPIDQRPRLVREPIAGHRSVHHAPRRGIGARHGLGRAAASRRARASPTRRGSSHVAPVSGVKPRSRIGLPQTRRLVDDGEVRRQGEVQPDPGRPPAHLADDRRLRR